MPLRGARPWGWFHVHNTRKDKNCLPRGYNYFTGDELIEKPIQLIDILVRKSKLGRRKIFYMMAKNDGFPAVGCGPILPVKYQGQFELYEPRVVAVWDIITINAP